MQSLFEHIKIDYNSYIGTKLGSVTLLKVLGAGSKGVVFSGFQERLNRQVAVKLLPKLMASDSEIELFTNEAEIVATMSHPNIIPIFEFGETDELYYHVMHMVNGFDLDTIINKLQKHPIPSKRVLPINKTFKIIEDVLDALDYAHDEGVYHRDIKPSNILIEKRNDRPFLADFGIAMAPGVQAESVKGLILGSPAYLAPEQARNDELNGQADIYALGMTMIKLLAGALPKRSETPEEVLRRKIKAPETFLISSLSEFSDNIDIELEQCLMKAIAPNKEKRYTTARSFLDALQHYRTNHNNRFITSREN